jgi:hypothetical protein
MTRLFQFMQRRPFGVSVVALVVSLPALATGVQFGLLLGINGRSFITTAVFQCLLSLVFSLAALLNLLGAEKRGCPANRVSLSVVVLFFAFASAVILGVGLLSSLGDRR